MNQPRARRRSADPALVAVVALVGLGIALRVAGLWREPWLDEAFTLSVVRSETWQAWLQAIAQDGQPPAYPVLVSAWHAVSDGVPWLRLLSALTGAVTIAVAMRWAALASARAMVIAGLLLASAPFLLRYGVELRAYSLLGLAAAWACLSAARCAAGERPRSSGWSLGLALALAVSTHLTAVLFIPAAIALTVVSRAVGGQAGGWREGWRRVPWLPIALATLLAAVAVGASRRMLAMVQDNWWMPSLDAGLAMRGLGEVLGLSGAEGTTWPVFAACAAAIVVLLFAARQARASFLPPLAAALGFWGLVGIVSVVWTPIWWPRILLPGLVPFVVAVAIAIAGLPRRSWRNLGIGLVVLAAAFTSARWILVDARTPVEPWRSATIDLGSGRDFPVICVPDYIDAALVMGLGLDPSRVVPVRIGAGGAALVERLAPAVAAAASGGPVGMVVRVDLTQARDHDAPVRAAGRLKAAVETTFRLHVALVLTADVELVPSLADRLAAVEAQLTSVLGEPVDRETGPRLRRLTYDVNR